MWNSDTDQDLQVIFYNNVKKDQSNQNCARDNACKVKVVMHIGHAPRPRLPAFHRSTLGIMAEHAARTVAPRDENTRAICCRVLKRCRQRRQKRSNIFRSFIHHFLFIFLSLERAGRQDQGVLGKKKNFIHRRHRDISGRGRR